MDNRIVILETKLEELQRQHRESEQRHREDMEKVFAKLDGLKADIARHVPCPAPGACLRLSDDLDDIKDSVKTLEAERQRRIGERTIIGTLSGFVGAGIVALINWLSKPHN